MQRFSSAKIYNSTDHLEDEHAALLTTKIEAEEVDK